MIVLNKVSRKYTQGARAIMALREVTLHKLLAAFAGIYPAQRAAKTNIVEALAYE
jgi:hypothetical protein